MSLMSILLLVGFLYIGFSSPFVVGLLFVLTLLISSLVVGTVDGFLGYIVFVVYVGGALVLFSYCFILTPLQETKTPTIAYSLPVVFLSLGTPLSAQGVLSEFYWVSTLLVSVGVLLFIVMLSVVSLIDFSLGSMRVQ